MAVAHRLQENQVEVLRRGPTNNSGAQAVVMHGAPLRYKLGLMRRWIEEDNAGVEIMGTRQLVKEHGLILLGHLHESDKGDR